MFRLYGFVWQLEDECFWVLHLLHRIRVAPARTKDCHRRTTDKIGGRQKAPWRAIQHDHGRLQEAFTPCAAKGQALVKGLPAYAHLRNCGIRIIIQPLVESYSC